MAGTTTLKRTESRGALDARTTDHPAELVPQPAVRIVELDSTTTLVVIYPA
jgi:hypothetical protein